MQQNNKTLPQKIIREIKKTPIWFRRYLVYKLDFIVPKNKNIILFGSSHGRVFTGNAKRLFEYCKTNKVRDFDIYFTLNEKQDHPQYYDPLSLKGMWIALRAKTIVITHGRNDLFYKFSSRKLFIQTWHGSPLKALFLADNHCRRDKSILKNLCYHLGCIEKKDLYIKPTEYKSLFLRKTDMKKRFKKRAKNINYILTSSSMVASSISRCFGLNDEKILNIGYPRNDTLFLRQSNNLLPKLVGRTDEKIILYAPTWRKTENIRYFPFPDVDLKALDLFLQENNTLMLVRGHINNETHAADLANCKQMRHFNNTICEDINDVLAEVDVLITDYSSVYFDFLLIDKPCIFIPYDLERYKQTQGLLYDNYEFIMAGDHVLTQKDFVQSLLAIFSGKDTYKHIRQEINLLFNAAQTGDTCKILLNKIRTILKKPQV